MFNGDASKLSQNEGDLPKSWLILQTLGATLPADQALYDACIQKALYVKGLVKVFQILKEVGATLEGDKALYEDCIKNAPY